MIPRPSVVFLGFLVGAGVVLGVEGADGLLALGAALGLLATAAAGGWR